MRKSGKWMSIVDDRVLEYISEHEHGSPKKMKEDGPIRYSRQYIAERCRELEKHGLIKNVGNAVYVITDRGEAYLEGEVDTYENGCGDSVGAAEENGLENSERSNG